jgi:thymidylate synthase (FAD)
MIKVSYINHMGNDLTVVNAARVSFNASSDSLTEKDEKLIKYLADHEHMSPFEHSQMTFLIECPLYIRSQIHRHRTFSYNEVSRRYSEEDLQFYVPSVNDLRKQSKSNRQASEGLISETEALDLLAKIQTGHEALLALYHDLRDSGVCREQARGVLPQNLMTKFYMTGNLRNIAHFIKLRSHEGAQQEARVVAEQMLAIVEQYYPVSIKALFN